MSKREPSKFRDQKPAGLLLAPRGSHRQYLLSAHADERATERGASRQVLLAALAGGPRRHQRDKLAVFSASGFFLLVDLGTNIVVTVLPKGGGMSEAHRRDSGCQAHRPLREVRSKPRGKRRHRSTDE